ncbi:bifunctional transcriptional activator/DNA repair enzyme AdaA [Kiloniella sp.]|uniref:bifunctional transcriptional activator/DNA repair enzyme AdaA n=1 Tax=Kiloniella sp. TaxID=1938587 RepID=UPI003B023637
MTLLIDPDMWQNWDSCDRARVARDVNYDGAFFTCVRTTKIYCRPICPVSPALSKNVFFVPTAAAAEKLKFRPCFRCRPESAPGSPAWRGTATTVARGLREIEGGYLDNHSLAELGDKLGVGVRHLSRLFRKHLNVTPSEIAATRRVQAAKRLISDTSMPLSEVAFEAGFSSIRQFNGAFIKIYRRPPSSFRRYSN